MELSYRRHIGGIIDQDKMDPALRQDGGQGLDALHVVLVFRQVQAPLAFDGQDRSPAPID